MTLLSDRNEYGEEVQMMWREAQNEEEEACSGNGEETE